MKSVSLVYFLLLSAPAEGHHQTFDPSPYVNLVVVLMIVSVIALVVAIPWLYRRLLDKESGDKNLNAFLLNDPSTRDLLLKKKAAPGRPATAKSATTPAQPARSAAPAPKTAASPVPKTAAPPAVPKAPPTTAGPSSPVDPFFADDDDAPPPTNPPKK